MSSKTVQIVDELSTALVEKSRVRRHPALIRRDALYAAASRFPRLTDDGAEKISSVPLATELIGLRPLSMQEQIDRFSGHGITDWSLVPDIDEDEWEDYLDDDLEFDPDGMSPYEIAAFHNQERYFNRGLKAPEGPPVVTGPSPKPASPSAPTTLGEGEAGPSDKKPLKSEPVAE